LGKKKPGRKRNFSPPLFFAQEAPLDSFPQKAKKWRKTN